MTVLMCFDARAEMVLSLQRPEMPTTLKSVLTLKAGEFNRAASHAVSRKHVMLPPVLA